MSRVKTEIEEAEIEGDHGMIHGLIITCALCGHRVEVYGTGEASAKRGAVMLSEECPEDQNLISMWSIGTD